MPDRTTIGGVMRAGLRGELPDRYDDFWTGPFRAELAPSLVPGVRVLDVGSGAEPTIPTDMRPEGTHYVGLDISKHELDRAPGGSYDETVVADLTGFVPALEGRFDLVVSFQVLEHVRPLDRAVENMRRYLRDGGAMVSRLSGGRSVSALLNRLIGHRGAMVLEGRLRGRDPASVFPAEYDRCTSVALRGMLSGWSEAKVIPQHTGALYFQFLRPLQALYLGYEEWAVRSGHDDAAVYYVLSARR
jgi:2-polyprenyl-6-hydroxyphenyl methylase/3-demethylubiquinone-9 3-methyltransferase